MIDAGVALDGGEAARRRSARASEEERGEFLTPSWCSCCAMPGRGERRSLAIGSSRLLDGAPFEKIHAEPVVAVLRPFDRRALHLTGRADPGGTELLEGSGEVPVRMMRGIEPEPDARQRKRCGPQALDEFGAIGDRRDDDRAKPGPGAAGASGR